MVKVELIEEAKRMALIYGKTISDGILMMEFDIKQRRDRIIALREYDGIYE
jgi:hypothetical protein